MIYIGWSGGRSNQLQIFLFYFVCCWSNTNKRNHITIQFVHCLSLSGTFSCAIHSIYPIFIFSFILLPRSLYFSHRLDRARFFRQQKKHLHCSVINKSFALFFIWILMSAIKIDFETNLFCKPSKLSAIINQQWVMQYILNSFPKVWKRWKISNLIRNRIFIDVVQHFEF